jgi:hypothetical protein
MRRSLKQGQSLLHGITTRLSSLDASGLEARTGNGRRSFLAGICSKSGLQDHIIARLTHIIAHFRRSAMIFCRIWTGCHVTLVSCAPQTREGILHALMPSWSPCAGRSTSARRPPHLRLYIVGAFKLANPLVNFGITAYTERWSALAPAGVLM